MNAKFRVCAAIENFGTVSIENGGTHGVSILVDDYLVATFSSAGVLRLSEFHPTSAQGKHLASLGMKFVCSRKAGQYVHIEAIT